MGVPNSEKAPMRVARLAAAVGLLEKALSPPVGGLKMGPVDGVGRGAEEAIVGGRFKRGRACGVAAAGAPATAVVGVGGGVGLKKDEIGGGGGTVPCGVGAAEVALPPSASACGPIAWA